MREPIRTVYFISSALAPKENSGGGNVVIYRHLSKLADEGFKVVFINAKTHNYNYSSFEQINLIKKIWYPPIRKGLPWLTWIRFLLQKKQINSKALFREKDLIISLLEDSAALLATMVAREHKIPLYLFFHDDNIFSKYFKDSPLHASHLKWIIKECKHFFAVSMPMKILLQNKGAKAVSVLYPIPSGYAGQKKIAQVNFEQLNIGHAGSLFRNFHLEIVQRIVNATSEIQGQLTFIGDLNEDFLSTFRKKDDIKVVPRFETTAGLFDFLLKYIDVLLVFYTMDIHLEIRSASSFPSKFVEFCHLGIPIVIIAPAESAIGQWAALNNWPTYLAQDDPESIKEILLKLKNLTFWQQASEKCLAHAASDFEPQKIHRQLLDLIN